MLTTGSPVLWASFLALILFFLALDLGVLNRKDHQLGAGEALRKIAKAAGLSIVLPSDDLEQVNASFQGVPVEDALRAVLEQAGLAAERQGTLLVVTEQPRGFSFKLGQFGLKGKLPPNVSREVEQAMRDADREMRQADREMRHAGRAMGGHRENDRVVHGDVVIRPGERVTLVLERDAGRGECGLTILPPFSPAAVLDRTSGAERVLRPGSAATLRFMAGFARSSLAGGQRATQKPRAVHHDREL